MAWFKKAMAEDLISELTIDRVAKVFDESGWKYDLEESRIITGFAGAACSIRFIGDSESLIMAITMSSTGHQFLPADRFVEVENWVNRWNSESIFGTAHAFVDDEGDVILQIDYAVPAGVGLSDAQLEMYLHVSIQCLSEGINKYFEDFELAELD